MSSPEESRYLRFHERAFEHPILVFEFLNIRFLKASQIHSTPHSNRNTPKKHSTPTRDLSHSPRMAKPKLFSPGPVDVAPETYAAMCGPTIGHRGADFEELYASVQPGLQEIAGTSRAVFLNTSSAWGIMEGALRNLTQKKVLNLCCGAFSDKWYGVAQSCGKEAEKIQVEWGQPIDPETVARQARRRRFRHRHPCSQRDLHRSAQSSERDRRSRARVR